MLCRVLFLLLFVSLQAQDICVKYEIYSEFEKQAVIPSEISLNGEKVEQNSYFPPGKYLLKIVALGHVTHQQEIELPPDSSPYTIHKTLVTQERKVKSVITGEFPRGEPIEPKVFSLNGKDVREHVFKPAKYNLMIANSGYETIRKEVVIPPGEEPFLIEEILDCIPRVLKEEITYDVAPNAKCDEPYVITLAPIDHPYNKRIVKDGDLIKPSSYILTISKKGYELMEVKKHVWPEEAPFVVDEQLIAKYVPIVFKVDYDFPTPNDNDESYSIIDRSTGALVMNLMYGYKLKPGKYSFYVEKPGYHSPTVNVEIFPGEKGHLFAITLKAKPRRIAFRYENSPVLIAPLEIVDAKTQHPISFDKEFAAGTELDVLFRFKEHSTVRKHISVVLGDGSMIVPVLLEPLLVDYSIPARNTTVCLDGIEYPYKFYLDGKEIESHHIKIETIGAKQYFTLKIPRSAKNLRVEAGYLYRNRNLSKMSIWSLDRLSGFDMSKFILHLDEIAVQHTHEKSLEILEAMLKTYYAKKLFKSCEIEEIVRLQKHVRNWQEQLEAQKIRLNEVIYALGNLKTE